MKNEIPEEYPALLDNEQLVELIKQYSKRATVAGRSEQYVVGPSYWKEMVELGQIEISNRIQNGLFSEIGKLANEIKLLKDDNRKSGRTNFVLSLLTIFLAVLTGYLGYITLDYSKSSAMTDARWKQDQIELLNQGNLELVKINKALTENSLLLRDSVVRKAK
ncbi:MAG: hypothetical protein EOO89_29755 [Pedobacter sp.]|nr:MAG: hypothetical protein EOO89_29755 [Pedobacter sp.]